MRIYIYIYTSEKPLAAGFTRAVDVVFVPPGSIGRVY